MKRHTFRDWVLAVRPWSFPASSMPVVVTLAYAYGMRQGVDWVNGVWALLNIVLFHAAANVWSDYFDYKYKVDAADTFGSKTLTDGVFSPAEAFRLSLCLLVVAVVAGLGLVVRAGLPVLYFGVGGCLATLLYPPLKYHALGGLVIFVTSAVLPTLGTVYVATGAVDWSVLWLAVPIGLITVAILHANNTRDIRTDGRASILTVAMLLGGRVSVLVYCAEVLLPFVWLAVCIAVGILPLWTLLMALALAPALANVRMVLRYFRVGESAIAQLDEMTAKLQIQFSLLFALSFVLARLV